MSDVDISILVVNYNTAHLLARMFETIEQARAGLSIEVIVVDNASRDDSVALLEQRFPDARLIRNTANVGFGRANNQALALARGAYILLLNTDAFMAPDCLRKSLDYLRAHPECGVLGARLIGEEGEAQPSCRFFPTPINGFLVYAGLTKLFGGVQLVDDPRLDTSRVCECDWVPGCYYMMPRAVTDRVGLFDPRYFLYFEEVDHCHAVKAAGWKVVCHPELEVVHVGGESAKAVGAVTKSGGQVQQLQVESELLFIRKHHGRSGLFLHLCLTTLEVGLQAAKALVRRRKSELLESRWKHLTLAASLARQTSFGTRPTR